MRIARLSDTKIFGAGPEAMGPFSTDRYCEAWNVCGACDQISARYAWFFLGFDTSPTADGPRPALYTTTGIVATALFWGSETFFWLFWGTDAMRELGAVLGLTIGYLAKYRLDRLFVFAG